MTEPENFEEDLFADLYDDDTPAKPAAAQQPAPPPAPVAVPQPSVETHAEPPPHTAKNPSAKEDGWDAYLDWINLKHFCCGLRELGHQLPHGYSYWAFLVLGTWMDKRGHQYKTLASHVLGNILQGHQAGQGKLQRRHEKLEEKQEREAIKRYRAKSQLEKQPEITEICRR
ncbi:hypothetical protein CCUS01_15664 [Colletotrichum cuscutae]|nr:hypothetical protein CCUS01_15664 [Colletotrichum cuscutae]